MGPLQQAVLGMLCPHGVIPASPMAEKQLAQAPGSAAVPCSVGRLNLSWDQQLVLGIASWSNLSALAK